MGRLRFRACSIFTVMALLLLLCTGCKEEAAEAPEAARIRGPFFGVTVTDTPQLLAPALLATAMTEYNGTFSPDGTEFFYTADLPGQGIVAYARMGDDSIWERPKVASFSGRYSDYDPLFAPDGQRLYFSSERPWPDTAQNNRTHIWYVAREGDRWGEPQPVSLTPNGDYFSSLTRDGTIYFNIWSKCDIFRAVPNDTGYAVEALPARINGGGCVGDPFISADEDYLVFRGYDGSLGDGDLYISFHVDTGWTQPQNLGAPINSEAHEMCPFVTPGGKLFVFSSARKSGPYRYEGGTSLDSAAMRFGSQDNGRGNIYVLSTDFIDQMRPAVQPKAGD